MADIDIRREGLAGRITLHRPKALNALTYEMCLAIDAALKDWRDDPQVVLVVIDATGERAFCAGGDIAEMYASGLRSDYAYGQKFWRDEYDMNAAIAAYPKPVVSFLQGFTMGGGVGVGCHCSHRIVGDSSQIAMPECGIGLVPDVGGSFILANAPGHVGSWLGMSGARMGPGDAIYAGFADLYCPEAHWEGLKSTLSASGDISCLTRTCTKAPPGDLPSWLEQINQSFGQETLADTVKALRAQDGDFAQLALRLLGRNSPLSMACAKEMQNRLRRGATLRDALDLEYRFTARSMQYADFIEGIRAQIIDRDKSPNWKHAGPEDVPAADIDAMLRPLDADIALRHTGD